MRKDLPLFLFDIVNIISFINFVDQQVVLNPMDQKDIVKSGKTVKDVNIKALLKDRKIQVGKKNDIANILVGPMVLF